MFENSYVLPPLSFLDDPKPQVPSWSEESINAAADLLESRLSDCRIEASVVAVSPGPVLTRFELELAPGVRSKQLCALAKDIARWLSVSSVEVIEVIPGKSTIGLEVPNHRRETIYLSEILRSKEFDMSRAPLSLGLGMTGDGRPSIGDLCQMMHLLVAGTTGSGKSVALNAMLLSLLYKAKPNKVRLLLIDPTDTEFHAYEGIPHLLAPVISDMSMAANGLRWCVAEMEKRFRLMSAVGVRQFAAFNEAVRKAMEGGTPISDPFSQPTISHGEAAGLLFPLPYIVVIIDEYAELIKAVGSGAEELTLRLTQKASSAGIHLIIATQRPDSGSITGLLKASMPSRIAFQVASRADSFAILDHAGAERLLGDGDSLYRQRGADVSVRIHGAVVGDDEVHRVVAFLREQSVTVD